MALTAEDYLYPRWRLKAEVFWPAKKFPQCLKLAKESLNGGLIARATAQIAADAVEDDDADDASRFYVGYLAADGRLQQMQGLPSTVDVRDEGSGSYAADQREWIEAFRDEMLAGYQGLVPPEEAEANTEPMPRTSRSSRACIELI